MGGRKPALFLWLKRDLARVTEEDDISEKFDRIRPSGVGWLAGGLLANLKLRYRA
jgi:hypothetical protein